MPQPAELREETTLPLLPLRDVVVFPHMVIPLFVGRAKSIRALESAMDEGKQVLLVAQRSASKDEPEADDLYSVGTIASVLQMLKLPDSAESPVRVPRWRLTHARFPCGAVRRVICPGAPQFGAAAEPA